MKPFGWNLFRPGLCRMLLLLLGGSACFSSTPKLQAFWGEEPVLTVENLEHRPKMTPRQFANLFETFRYELHRTLQPPDVFLSSRSGDCDDYAVLAARVLRHHGYKTRVIFVSMAGLNIRHAVCYVDTDGIYLDYNNRKYLFNLERCGPGLAAIAAKVAGSFNRPWTRVSEWICEGDTFQNSSWIAQVGPGDIRSGRIVAATSAVGRSLAIR